MKYIFLFSFILLASFGSASAQITGPTLSNQCIRISASNVGRCCATSNTFNNPELAQRCDEYRQGVITGPTGGTQQTNPAPGNSSNGTFSVPSSAPGLQSCSAIEFKSLIDILIWLKCIIAGLLIPLIFSLAFLFFLWGVFKFMRASDAKNKQEAQKMIWWGLLGLFIMVSVWGIIKIVSTTLGLDSSVVPVLQTEYLKR